MGKLTVQLPNAQYDVHVGDHVYDLFLSDYRGLLKTADRIGIIADDLVATKHLPVLLL